MDYLPGLLCLGVMIIIMLMGVPIAYSMGVIALIVGIIFFGTPVMGLLGRYTFSFLFRMAILPLPLFFMLACIIAETRMGEDLYGAASKWLSRVPGGLVAASIVGEAAMASVMGHSGGCIISVGKIAVPEFERYGYHRGFSLGALCCGGVLGPLIPPSSLMIVMTLFAEVSLGRLFIGGIIPGIILTIMLAGVAIVMSLHNPRLGPPAGSFKWSERFGSLKRVWPVIVLMLSILGSIYLGVATPTEAAGFGCFVALVIGVVVYGFRMQNLRRALIEAAIINGMIVFVIIGAAFFTYVVGSSGLGKLLTGAVASSGMPPMGFIISVMVIYLILGCFMDGMTILLLTLPIFVPVIIHLGFDMVWFGVLVVVNMQIGLITPPLGLDLYIMRNTFGIPVGELIRGVIPFLITLIIFLGILAAFPQLTLWLPNMMKG
jgi:tripartite ATP-independent transporter DctM subunit